MTSLWKTLKELFTGPRIQTQFEEIILEEEANKLKAKSRVKKAKDEKLP